MLKGDPVEFLSWFLNALHLALNGTKKPTSSIIYKTFLGAMRIHSQRIPPIDATDKEKDELMLTEDYVETCTDSPFLFLAAELPPPPLFKDEFRENIIPQVGVLNYLIVVNEHVLSCYVLSGVPFCSTISVQWSATKGIQNLQRELFETIRADQIAKVHLPQHQEIYQEHILR